MNIQDFRGILVEKKYLSDDVMFLSLQVPQTFSFTAGQYILLKIVQQDQFRWKSYSILNPPKDRGKVDLCVTIIPGGFASEVFKRAKVGDEFLFKAPIGQFAFDEEAKNKEHWFICLGTGITPMYSMIKEHLGDKKFVLLFGEKTKKDLLFYDEFRKLEEQFPYFIYLPVVSREKWEGKVGHVQMHLPANTKNKIFYVCGLKEMVLETKEMLLKQGVNPENIKVERYT